MNLKRDERVCHTKSKVTVLDFNYGNKGLVEYISKRHEVKSLNFWSISSKNGVY